MWPSSAVILALAAMAVGASAADAQAAAAQVRVPVESEQGIRLKTLKDIYKREYAQRKPDERIAFARKLLDQGLATTDDLVARFVFLREAQEMAAKAGNLDTGLKAVEALSAGYAIDAGEQRLRFYTALMPAVDNLEVARAVIDGHLALVAEAVAADEYPFALRAATQADGFARRLKDASVPARTQVVLDQTKALAAEYAALGPLRDLIGDYTVPGHAKYGRFACFEKGDWEKGLSHLAQGDDVALKALALGEAAAATPEANLACADAWYDWAQKQKAKARSGALAHAGELYRRALPGLTGLTLARIDKRLSELDKLVSGRPRFPEGAVLIMTFEAPTVDGTTVWDQSPQRHAGRITGAKPSKGPWGTAMEFDGVGAVVTIPNHTSLQTVGSSTLMMWLKPAQLGARCNLWGKAYGGEGSWTLEPTGSISGYYGIAGADDDPYAECNLNQGILLGESVHVAQVRDLEAKQITWYRNGAMQTSQAPNYPAMKASPNDVTIGGGSVRPYAGLIDEVALWPRALSAKEINAVYDSTVTGRKK